MHSTLRICIYTHPHTPSCEINLHVFSVTFHTLNTETEITMSSNKAKAVFPITDSPHDLCQLVGQLCRPPEIL